MARGQASAEAWLEDLDAELKNPRKPRKLPKPGEPDPEEGLARHIPTRGQWRAMMPTGSNLTSLPFYSSAGKVDSGWDLLLAASPVS